jgi:hypothetical protein
MTDAYAVPSGDGAGGGGPIYPAAHPTCRPETHENRVDVEIPATQKKIRPYHKNPHPIEIIGFVDKGALENSIRFSPKGYD